MTWRAVLRYFDIDGEQRAAAFAYYAFFSIFPLVLLLVMLGSLFLDAGWIQAQTIRLMGEFIPLSDQDRALVNAAVGGFVRARGGAGLIAFLAVAWTSLRFFQALVRGVNRAWGTVEYSWWRLPIQNLMMVAVVALSLLVGIFAPAILAAVENYWRAHDLPWAYSWAAMGFSLGRRLVAPGVLFIALLLFYKLAPRRHVPFRGVWMPSLVVLALLQFLQWLFVLYVRNFANFNAIYGAFAGPMALLMWIYLSGSVLIFGGCLCAAASGNPLPPTDAHPRENVTKK